MFLHRFGLLQRNFKSDAQFCKFFMFCLLVGCVFLTCCIMVGMRRISPLTGVYPISGKTEGNKIRLFSVDRTLRNVLFVWPDWPRAPQECCNVPRHFSCHFLKYISIERKVTRGRTRKQTFPPPFCIEKCNELTSSNDLFIVPLSSRSLPRLCMQGFFGSWPYFPPFMWL